MTLRTQNAPLRAILDEWARLGGAQIVNGERVAGPPLTLQIEAVPERQALDILLRNVSGYLLAPRRAGATGTAVFDRIVILPTSTGPRNPPPPGPAGRGFPAVRPVPQPSFRQPMVPEAEPEPEPDDIPPDDIEPTDEDAPVVNPLIRTRPGFDLQPDPVEEQPEPEDEPVEEAEPATTTPANNPFGIPPGTTTRPGVVTPVPEQQPQPRTPRDLDP